MGADLYIESNYHASQLAFRPIFEAAVANRDAASSAKIRECAQDEIAKVLADMQCPNAYFLDPYNSNSLLAQLGLSWWADIAPKLTEDDHLPVEGVRWLLEEVRQRHLNCENPPTTEQILAAEVVAKVSGASISSHVFTRETYSVADVEWFVSRKLTLITFLETAIRLHEEPICSL